MDNFDIDDVFLDLDDEFENILEEESFEEENSNGLVTSLPLVAPTIPSFTSKPFSLSTAVEVTKNAGKLFDFTGTTLSPQQQMYIIGYATRGNRKGACEIAGIPYSVITKWQEIPEFSAKLIESVNIVGDSLEEELLRRAINGSDRLLLEAVKATNAEKYNKKQTDVNINGNIVHTWADLAKQAALEPSLSSVAIEVDFEVE